MTDEEAVRRHSGLVYKAASKFPKSYDFEDLVSEGFIGLIKANRKFDESMGFRFSTYASKTIYFSMLDYTNRLADSGPKYPSNVREIAVSIRKYHLEELPSDEIAARLKVKEQFVKRSLEFLNRESVIRLDVYLKDSETPHDKYGKPFDTTRVEVAAFLDTLTAKQRRIVELKMKDLNYREIGDIYGVTRAAVSVWMAPIKEKYIEWVKHGELLGESFKKV